MKQDEHMMRYNLTQDNLVKFNSQFGQSFPTAEESQVEVKTEEPVKTPENNSGEGQVPQSSAEEAISYSIFNNECIFA